MSSSPAKTRANGSSLNPEFWKDIRNSGEIVWQCRELDHNVTLTPAFDMPVSGRPISGIQAELPIENYRSTVDPPLN
ncbi:hypothetical protein OAG76_01670 [Rubripirellula sp.]|nr:hypothetical protein [Rubripirellula sp.]MDB4634091.1 hypothetical protein [Rubripirellula sp.]